MKMHVVTNNNYLYLGLVLMAEQCGYIVTALNLSDKLFHANIDIDDLILFDLDCANCFSLEKLAEVNYKTKLILIGNDKLRYDYFISFNSFIAHRAALTTFSTAFMQTMKSPRVSSICRLNLTSREQVIALKILDGLNVKLIAKQLDISNKTVYSHIYSICDKFGARNIYDLFAIKTPIYKKISDMLWEAYPHFYLDKQPAS